jgi:hypothetical protein
MNKRSPLLLMALSCAALAACGSRTAPASPETIAAGSRPAAESPPAEAADVAPGASLALDKEQVAKLGLVIEPAVAAAYHAEVEAFGQVWSHEAIAQLAADVATAEAAAHQSAAALARIQALSQTPGAFPAEAQEGAQRQAATDAAALQLAHRRLSALLGDRLPGHLASRGLSDLASGKVKLVKVTFPLGNGPRQVPASLRLMPLGAAASTKGWQARAVWEAPSDSSVPGYSVWATASGDGLLEGDRLVARVQAGPAQAGVLVPDSAALVSEDRLWCIVEKPEGTFRRVPIDTRRPVDAGYVVAGGLAANDRLVVRGAGLLLARMMGAGAEAE